MAGQRTSFLIEPGRADLAAKVRDAWRDFREALASAVGQLGEAAEISIALDPTASGTGIARYDVRVSRRPDGEIYADAVSNAGLPPGFQLDREPIAALVALGWSPPGVVESSGERFGYLGPAQSTEAVADLLSRTLRDVFHAPHPAFLTYTATADKVPDLGTARHVLDFAVPNPELPTPSTPLTPGELRDRVQAIVAGMLRTPPDELAADGDNDITVRAGSAMVFIRVSDSPAMVDVFSPILTEIKPSEPLYERLSQLTRRMPIGRLYYADDTIWASVPVFGRDFQATHLTLAVQVMRGLADELDDRLQKEFGGKRFFTEEGESTEASTEPIPTGMYL